MGTNVRRKLTDVQEGFCVRAEHSDVAKPASGVELQNDALEPSQGHWIMPSMGR